jgi:4-diphosphocytidyl-2-C-methyl-D-erythritol kinase
LPLQSGNAPDTSLGIKQMKTVEVRVQAPAKVNLSLRVVGRRTDGYHLLDSIMVPVDLYDDLIVRMVPGQKDTTVTATSNSRDAPGGSTNLAYRAADLFLQHLETRASVDIQIIKRIPIGSGMGGGSSDAAAVLLVLNRLLGSPLRSEELATMGTQLGADVAFFLYGRAARVTGIGEQVAPLRDPISLPLVLCWDRYSLSTAQVYSRVELSLTTLTRPTNIPTFASDQEPFSELLVNDLEAAASQIHPEVLSLKARLLEQGALGALMTGSGAAVFGVWPDSLLAQRAAERLRERGLWAESVRTLDVSPAVTN